MKPQAKLIISIMVFTIILVFFAPINVYAENSNQQNPDASMTVYGIFMFKNNGTVNKYDKWGDASLIESDGNYLLIDTGDDLGTSAGSSLCNTLKNMGITELDVYISHLHQDHTKGLDNVCDNFKVNNIYLPDKSLAKEYRTPNTHKPIAEIHEDMAEIAQKEQKDNGVDHSIITYLCPDFRSAECERHTSTITVGDVTGKVIGPVGNHKLSSFASIDGWCGTQEGHYLNNWSISTMFTCGDIKYLTCGDIESQEEKLLVSKYGSELNADIWKASHHGLRTSSTIGFLDKVTPRWIYAENHGYFPTTANMDGMSRISKYGYFHKVADKQASFIAVVENNKVKLYSDNNRNGIIDESPLTGWVKVPKGYQYYNSDGTAANGLTKVGSSYYYFTGEYGCRAVSRTVTIDNVTCKFNSSGVMTSPAKPATAYVTSAKALKEVNNKVNWNAVKKAEFYEIFRSTKKTGTYECIGRVNADIREYIDTDVVRGQAYYYKVRAGRDLLGIDFTGNLSSAKGCVTYNPIEGIEITSDFNWIAKGASKTLKTTPTPAKATNKSVKWSSSDKTIATVSTTGVVKGLKEGTVEITATSKENAEISDTVKVHVGKIDMGAVEGTDFVAHRGHIAIAPENTIAAFNAATAAGYKYVEFDIWESKRTTGDEVAIDLMVMHDKSIYRTCGISKYITAVNLNNRDKYPVKKGKNVSQYSRELRIIPTAQEALSAIYDGGANPVIEIKPESFSDEAIDQLLNAIAERDGKATIVSFKSKPLLKVQSRIDEMVADETLEKNQVIVQYVTSSVTSKNYKSKIDFCVQSGFAGISVKYTQLSAKIVQYAHDNNINVGAWTATTITQASSLVNKGVDRITCNNQFFK